MPDEQELEMITTEILDRQDTERRRARLLPWNKRMIPTPETDEADEAAERSEKK
jgi:hypothetical protein